MTLTTLETVEISDLDFELPCEDDDSAADWILIFKCCGGNAIWCQQHVDVYDFNMRNNMWAKHFVCGYQGELGEDIFIHREPVKK